MRHTLKIITVISKHAEKMVIIVKKIVKTNKTWVPLYTVARAYRVNLSVELAVGRGREAWVRERT